MNRLYTLFFEDHSAWLRMQATALGSGFAVSVFLAIAGFPPGAVFVCAPIGGGLAMAIVAFRYTKRSSRTVAAPGKQILRRTTLVAALAGLAEWVFGYAFENVAAAVAFATTASEAVASDKTIFPPRAAFYQAVVAQALGRREASTSRGELVNAYAKLTVAREFSEIRPTASNQLVGQGSPRPVLGRPLRFSGAGPDKTIVPTNASFRPGDELILVGGDSIIDSIGFISYVGAAQKPVTFIRLERDLRPRVLVVNCKATNLEQDMAYILWFRVEFDNCFIRISSSNAVLVDCTFKNCTISADAVLRQAFPNLESGNISGVTYTSVPSG